MASDARCEDSSWDIAQSSAASSRLQTATRTDIRAVFDGFD